MIFFKMLLYFFSVIGFLSTLSFFMDIKEKKKNKNKTVSVNVEIVNGRLNNNEGINFYKEYSGIKHVCYNFSEENYYGYIKQNVNLITIEELDKLIEQISQWAEKEKKRNARIKAYENTPGLK